MSTAETASERGIGNKPIATVNTSPNGDVLGACLFLCKEDLEALGIDDAAQIQYAVENGDLQIEVSDE